jgi:hypothetical protein
MTSRPVLPAFAEHFETATQRLRASLTELLTENGARPDKPQEISRRFGLNKNLAWKIARIVTAQDSTDIVPLMPGASGLRLALDAFAKHGARKETIESVRRASAQFDLMTTTHAKDRKGLELLLSSMLPDRIDRERLENSRKLAFQGNSATLGLQVQSSFTTTIMTPSASQEGWLDFTLIRGLVGFQRLRPHGSWPMISLSSYGVREKITALDPSTAEGQAPLLKEFCSDADIPIESVVGDDGTRFEMGPGPVGKTASSTTVFGWRLNAAAPIQGGGADEVGEHFFRLDLPSERVQYDLLIHRDIKFPDGPKAFLYNLMPGQVTYPLSQQAAYSLPLPETVLDLGVSPVLATQFVPHYRSMVESVCVTSGWDLREFRCYRLEVCSPPIPSILVLAHPLANG